MITRDAVDLDRRFEEALNAHDLAYSASRLFVMDMPFGTAAAE
jgi:hypothetical protein